MLGHCPYLNTDSDHVSNDEVHLSVLGEDTCPPLHKSRCSGLFYVYRFLFVRSFANRFNSEPQTWFSQLNKRSRRDWPFITERNKLNTRQRRISWWGQWSSGDSELGLLCSSIRTISMQCGSFHSIPCKWKQQRNKSNWKSYQLGGNMFALHFNDSSRFWLFGSSCRQKQSRQLASNCTHYCMPVSYFERTQIKVLDKRKACHGGTLCWSTGAPWWGNGLARSYETSTSFPIALGWPKICSWIFGSLAERLKH